MRESYDESLLLGYVEGELDAAGVAKVQQWMRSDPRLERLLRQMIADREALRTLPDPPAPPWLMEEADRHIERAMLIGDSPNLHRAGEAHRRFRLRRWAAAAAVAAMLAVVAGLVVWSVTPPGTHQLLPPMAVKLPPKPPRTAPPTTPAAAERPATEPASVPEPPAAEPQPIAAEEGANRPMENSAAAATEGRPRTVRMPWEVDLGSVLARWTEPAGSAAIAAGQPSDPPPPAPAPDQADDLPNVFARIGPPDPQGLLTPSSRSRQSAEVEVIGDRALEEWASAVGKDSKLAAASQVRIVTTDSGFTRARLAELSDPGGASSTAPQPQIRVSPERLPEVIRSLRSDAAHLTVRVYRPSGAAVERSPAGAEPGEAAARVSVPVVIHGG